MPALEPKGLWRAQLEAVRNLEVSLAEDRPRALIQMATGSGKTFTSASAIYRLINVQHLTSNKLDPVARVCIATIQRLYSILRGQELDPADEEGSLFDSAAPSAREPLPVAYNPAVPIEYFDLVFTDECHRSIYNLWRQVLEYFDAHLVGLTATPSRQTLGFFNQNLVMEYGHEQAVADGVNVDFQVYKIRTELTAQGSRVEAGEWVDKRDRLTRAVRWEQLDEELAYDADALDRKVVAKDQIRTILRTFKEKLPVEIFPGRKEVPKTLIFAKDDSHADDIVQIVREEFGKGNEFAKKITYRTTGEKPENLIAEFRNSYNPRVVVTVDMIATGTDIKPLEIVMFMRAVRSRNFFEQMKGRGVRVIGRDDFQVVTPGGHMKTHFVIVDCVGVTEHALAETRPLERKPSVSLEKLLQDVALGSTDAEVVSSLAARLARLARLGRQLGKPEQQALAEAAGGKALGEIVRGLIEAIDPDRQLEAARVAGRIEPEEMPSAEQVAKAAALMREVVAPLKTRPALRNKLLELKQRFEQVIDTISKDRVLEAGFSAEAKEKAKALARSFEEFIREHKDELTALQVMYSKPWARRLRYEDIKALAKAIEAPPRSWTPEELWRAYEALDKSKVRGASGERLLTDVVSLVRYALQKEDELVPFPERVEERFTSWLAQQENKGRKFTAAQREWLESIKKHIATSFKIEKDDFDNVPFVQKGGMGKVYQLFGNDLDGLLEELNEELVA